MSHIKKIEICNLDDIETCSVVSSCCFELCSSYQELKQSFSISGTPSDPPPDDFANNIYVDINGVNGTYITGFPKQLDGITEQDIIDAISSVDPMFDYEISNFSNSPILSFQIICDLSVSFDFAINGFETNVNSSNMFVTIQTNLTKTNFVDCNGDIVFTKYFDTLGNEITDQSIINNIVECETESQKGSVKPNFVVLAGVTNWTMPVNTLSVTLELLSGSVNIEANNGTNLLNWRSSRSWSSEDKDAFLETPLIFTGTGSNSRFAVTYLTK